MFSQALLPSAKLQQNLAAAAAREGFPKKQRTKRELDREAPREAGPEQMYDDLKESETKDGSYDWYGQGRSSRLHIGEDGNDNLIQSSFSLSNSAVNRFTKHSNKGSMLEKKYDSP